MQTAQPCLLVIPGHKRGSISESTIGSIASNDDGYVWTAKHRPCPTCKKGWIEASNLSPIDEGAQGANGHRSIWDKVPRVTWLTRPLNNPKLSSPHACPANCEARHSKFVVASDLPLTPDPAYQTKGARSILSGSASVASRGDNDSLASGRNPRSVKFSEEASVIYYDYDMMLCESTDDLSVASKANPAAATLGVLHRIVNWIKRVANKKAREKSSEKDQSARDTKGKEVPVISGPYRLWDASASVEHEMCRRPRQQPARRPSLKDMFKDAGCT